MSVIIAKAPDFVWDGDDTEENNVCFLLQYMGEAEDKWGDPVYDYYSIAHWVIKFLDASRWEIIP